MNLPAAIFTSALREVEEHTPLAEGGTDAFLAAMRAECARRGWVQVDLNDYSSWEFHEVAGFDNTSSGPVQRPALNMNPGGFETDAVERPTIKPTE